MYNIIKRIYHFFVPTYPCPELTELQIKRGAIFYTWNGFTLEWETRNTKITGL